MKRIVFLVVSFFLASYLMFYPISYQVQIEKANITENRPFAGVLNGETVGTELCVIYWMKYANQPDIATYQIHTTPLGKFIGSARSELVQD